MSADRDNSKPSESYLRPLAVGGHHRHATRKSKGDTGSIPKTQGVGHHEAEGTSRQGSGPVEVDDLDLKRCQVAVHIIQGDAPIDQLTRDFA